MDALAATRLSGYEHSVLYFLIRKTYGWHKKEDFISLSQVAEGTGLRTSHICRTLKRLQEQNMITKNGNGRSIRYGLQKDYEKWISLPKKVITKNGNGKKLPKMVMQVTKNGNKSLPNLVDTKERKETITKDIDGAAIKHLIDHHFQNYQRKFNKKYVVSGGKDGSLLKKLLKSLEKEEIKKLNDLFFQSDDPFVQKAGYTIAVFFSQINKLQVMQKQLKQGFQPPPPLPWEKENG